MSATLTDTGKVSRPWPLSDPQTFWRLDEGEVEIYAIFLDENGRAAGPRRWIGTVEQSQIICGAAPEIDGAVQVGLLAVPIGQARVTPSTVASETAVEDWRRLLGLDPDLPLIQAQAGWLADLATDWWRERDARAERLAGQASLDRSREAAARQRLRASQDPDTRRVSRSVVYQDQLWNALCLVLAEHKMAFERPRIFADLAGLANQLRVRCRRIRLDSQLISRDAGAILIDAVGEETVKVLLPGAKGYLLIDTRTGTRERLTLESLAQLPSHGWRFYPSLPTKALAARDLLVRVVLSSKRDLWRVAAMAMLAAALGLVTPIAFQFVFDAVVPQGLPGALLSVGLGLIGLMVGRSLLEAAQTVARHRLGAAGKTALSAALWDRLLRLDVGFFRRWTAGELAERLAGLETVRQALLRLFLDGGIALLSALFALGLMVGYHGLLTLALLPPVAVLILFLVLQGIWLLRWQRRAAELDGRLASLVLQTFSGIRKLRLAAAESRAFRRWAEPYTERRQVAMTAGRILRAFVVLRGIVDVGMAMLIFYATMELAGSSFSIGTFIAFMTAFGMFQAALLTITDGFLELLRSWPWLERAKPLLETLPADARGGADPGKLVGGLVVQDLHFAYDANGPAVLNGIDLRIEPGEFVAVVGPSGSGKSTLLRLLLGFERPENGVIYVDGRDLSHLDGQAYRRRVGVVLQHDKLFAGSVLTNIRSTHHAAIDEVWRALDQAGVAEDVASWPMNLHTMIAEGASTISGGQKQRLLLARSLLAQPNILFLDEATSALDNASQSKVMASMAALEATRIVIAHRLETVRAADRIMVMDKGRIVQSGTFDALIEQPGAFRKLYGEEQAG